MAFVVAGDTHGTLDIGKLVNYFDNYEGSYSKDDYLIILGDVGVFICNRFLEWWKSSFY